MPALFTRERHVSPGLMELLATNPHGMGQGRALFSQPSYQESEDEALRTIVNRARLQAAGFNPDVTIPQSLGAFGKEAALQLGAAALPALRAAPRALGLATGLGAYLGLPGSGGADEDADRIKALQRLLKQEGYYSGNIDGNMGPMTQRAKTAYETDRLERQRLQTQQEQAAAARAESERLRLEQEQVAKERFAGEERLRQMEGEVPVARRALREYGPLLGYGVGAGLGLLGRTKMTGLANRASARAAARSSELVSGAGDPASRIGGINTFWQEGGAAAVPFTSAPRARFAVRSNRAAPSAASLYPAPPTRAQYFTGRDVGVLAGAGGEAAFGQVMAQQAQEELTAAQQAVSADPSEANIRRLETARDRMALWEFTGNLGRGFGMGYGGAAFKSRYRPSRPDVAAAEAERIRLDRLLKRRAPRKKAK